MGRLDSYSQSLNAFKSVTGLSREIRDKNRIRNSNSFSKNKDNNSNKSFGKNYIEKENCKFAGYAASPDPTSLPQIPKDWITSSIKQLQLQQQQQKEQQSPKTTNHTHQNINNKKQSYSPSSNIKPKINLQLNEISKQISQTNQ